MSMSFRGPIILAAVYVPIFGTFAYTQSSVSKANTSQLSRSAPPLRFFLRELPTLENAESSARAINDNEQVAGLLRPRANEEGLKVPDQVVFWNLMKSTMIPIPQYVTEVSINNKGSVLVSRQNIRASYTKNNVFGYTWRPLKNPKKVVTLKIRKSDPPQMHVFTALNDNDSMVGYSGVGFSDNYGRSRFHAFLLKNGLYQYLKGFGANSYAFSINNSGLIVGKADLSAELSPTHAVSWKGNVIQDLQVLDDLVGGNSCAYDVNDQGEVVGFVEIVDYPDVHRDAFVYKAGKMHDLGIPGSVAYSINNHEQIVGSADFPVTTKIQKKDSHACLWQDGQFYDLNDCIANTSGWMLEAAGAINNKGQIVGTGIYRGKHRAFLLTPEKQ